MGVGWGEGGVRGGEILGDRVGGGQEGQEGDDGLGSGF